MKQIIVFLWCSTCFAQNTESGKSNNGSANDLKFQVRKAEEQKNEIVQLFIIGQQPEYPGGFAEMNSFISRNLKYPVNEQMAGISGTVYIEFVVTANGKITMVRTIRGISGAPSMAKEAERVISTMPDWIPGEQDGKKVDVRYIIPVSFSLKD